MARIFLLFDCLLIILERFQKVFMYRSKTSKYNAHFVRYEGETAKV